MNARRDSSDGPGAGSLGGRALLVGAVVFAAAATGLLVLTDEQKWLRLGIVAALWAALTGAFLAARYRRQLGDQRESADERQEIYQLELEREIAARREFELEVEAEAKRKAEETSRDDIAALRTELQNMRQTLESLLGGEFLVERYALHAESTRMRSLPEDRSLAVRHDVKHLPSAGARSANMVVPQVVHEAETELIERVREVHQPPRREQPPPHRQEPRPDDVRPPSVPRRQQRPERPAPEPTKPVARPEQPAARQEQLVARQEQLVVRPEQPATRQEPLVARQEQPVARQEQPVLRQEQPVVRQEPPHPPHLPPPRVEHPAEVSDRWFVPDGLKNQPPHQEQLSRQELPQRQDQPRRHEQQRPLDPVPRRPVPPGGWETGPQEWARTWENRHEEPPVPRRPEPAQGFEGDTPFGPSPSEQTNWLAQYNKPQNGEPTYGSRAYVARARADVPQHQPEPTLTDRPSHRSPEHHVEELPVPESGGGRRRRAEGQPPWQETVGRRAEEPSGSHASGLSVSELLASHGVDASPRRRRRREE